MTAELLADIVGIWVSRYIAIFCLLSLLAWGTGTYLLLDHWMKPVRDTAIYLLTIGMLTLILAIRPVSSDVLFWPPVTWFCFAMLLIMELFWLTFLADACVRLIRKTTARFTHGLPEVNMDARPHQLPKSH